MPTSAWTMPAKIMSTQALTKNMGPAANSLKKSLKGLTSAQHGREPGRPPTDDHRPTTTDRRPLTTDH
jgi:hypothetical protein